MYRVIYRTILFLLGVFLLSANITYADTISQYSQNSCHNLRPMLMFKVAGAMHQKVEDEKKIIGTVEGPYGHIIDGMVFYDTGTKTYIKVEWEKSQKLQGFYKEILQKSMTINRAGNLSNAEKEKLLKCIFDVVKQTPVSRITKKFLTNVAPDEAEIPLDKAFLKSGSVDSVFGIVKAAISERFIKEGYLDGKIYFRQGLHKDYGEHTWVEYVPLGDTETLILDVVDQVEICKKKYGRVQLTGMGFISYDRSVREREIRFPLDTTGGFPHKVRGAMHRSSSYRDLNGGI